MRTRVCAVCGKTKPVAEFGNGITIPKTTCLKCRAKTLALEELATIMFIKRIVRGEL